MKKLMFAAAAIAAGVAVADVTSANVVGYQNLGMDLGVSKISAPTFLKIGGARKIKDLTPISKGGNTFLQSNFYLNFYDSIGNMLLVKNVDWINDEKNVDKAIKNDSRVYSGKLQIGYNANKKHWYLAGDNSGKYPMDEFPIPAGEGFLMKVASAHTEGVTVRLPPAIEPTDK